MEPPNDQSEARQDGSSTGAAREADYDADGGGCGAAEALARDVAQDRPAALGVNR